MLDRFKEYLKWGAGRLPGTMWAMEKAYFEFKYAYPGKDEYAYLRFALQSRYPEKRTQEIADIAARCKSLEDAILEAVELDFGVEVAEKFRLALWSLPLCSVCRRYRAISTVDSLCYGCRNFGDLIACHRCRLYWKKDSKFCQKCGSSLIR